ELKEEKKVSAFKIFIQQFKSLVIIILIIASIISIFVGERIEAIAILIIVTFAAGLGFIQEYHASKAIESLKKLASPSAMIVRDKNEKEIEAKELVPGDLIIIKSGDKVPADSRLIEINNLKIDEATLTGESLPVEKQTEELEKANLTVADRKNLIFMGTAVSSGNGKAIVVNTGTNTEFGKIAGLLEQTEANKTPLQKNLDNLTKWLGLISVILAAMLSGLGIMKGHSINEMFIWGIAIIVAVIPEALPAVVTTSLAIGVKRLVKRKALIRKLPVVETLGATTVICTDKTGTLTKDEMTVRKIFTDNNIIEITGTGYAPEGEFLTGDNKVELDQDSPVVRLLKLGVLCNDANLTNESDNWGITGDPTEGALIVAAAKAKLKLEDINNEFPRISEIPFSSETKRMTTVHKSKENNLAISKGAPEVILKLCSHIRLENKVTELTNDLRKTIEDTGKQLASDALRILALCTKEIKEENAENVNEGMVFEGLFGMIDPPRPEIKSAIKVCREAGIKTVMITGDHKITAIAIAKELGILKDENALSGEEFEAISENELSKVIENTVVFARISPEHKLKLVNAFIEKGHVVAMIGDGVNDAPALKKADIGIAMGITGTDVSREASDMILTDDNFSSIVSAVEEGRTTFENIHKCLILLLSGNIGTIIALSVVILINQPIPLSSVNILFINFIMDGLIAIAIGAGMPEPGIMKQKPRKVKNGIFDKNSIIFTVISSILIAGVTIASYLFLAETGSSDLKQDKYAATVFFVALIMARVFNSFNCISLNHSILKIKLINNKYLFLAILISLIFTLIVVYINFFSNIFKIQALDLNDWLLITGITSLVLVFMEIWKIVKNKFFKTVTA
ncbi:MAG: cation-translocating P-type ATPase, partial [Flavobacterium sp.]|nr:cation-translocating P-type ATPase [Pedobacter sp.]